MEWEVRAGDMSGLNMNCGHEDISAASSEPKVSTNLVLSPIIGIRRRRVAPSRRTPSAHAHVAADAPGPCLAIAVLLLRSEGVRRERNLKPAGEERLRRRLGL